MSNIDIVNINSKKSTTSTSNGDFNLFVKPNDELFIISKEYSDRKITISGTDLNQENFTIILEKKAIELEDVNITRVKSMKIKIAQSDIDEIKITKSARALKPLNVYDGTIPNGIDFMRMGKGLINLFKNKDKVNPEKPLPAIPFKAFLAINFDSGFYTQKLKLNPEEIALFISFCEADPRAKIISEHNNVLEAVAFLISKNEEFKKLKR